MCVMGRSMVLMSLLALGLSGCGGEQPGQPLVSSASASAASAQGSGSAVVSPSESVFGSPSATASMAVGRSKDEDDAQGQAARGDHHPLPTYGSLSEVIAYPKGVFQSGFSSAQLNEEAMFTKEINSLYSSEHFQSLPVKEQAEHLFAKLLYYFAEDYSEIKPLDDYGYIVFQNDKVDPVTAQPLGHDAVQVNLELVLDASGSMAKQINGQSMMDIAKESISKTIHQLPPGANVALRVYGHKGNNTASGKTESCASSELIQPLSPVNVHTLNNQLSSITPTGWTPLATSIARGGDDFAAHQGDNQLNILYVISDGIETCDGDPIAAAANLKQLNVKPVLGIIGFNVDPTQELHLKRIAQAGGGHYASATTADSLVSELAQIHTLANSTYDWKVLSKLDVSNVISRRRSNGITNTRSRFRSDANDEQFRLRRVVSTLDRRIDFNGEVVEQLNTLIKKRHDAIEHLYKPFFEDRERENERRKVEYESRIGELAAIVSND